MLDRRGGYEYEDLLACGRGELFGPGNAQLPLPPMLMFDRISEISETGGEYGKGLIRAELDVKPDLWFFGCHFKGDPVMPGCLGLDALWQMVGFFLGWIGGERPRPRAGARRTEVLRPGAAERPQGCVQHRHQARDALKARAGHRRWLAFQADGEIIYRAKDLRVGLFKQGTAAGLNNATDTRHSRTNIASNNSRTAGRGDHEAGCHHGDGYRLVHRKQHPGSACEPS